MGQRPSCRGFRRLTMSGKLDKKWTARAVEALLDYTTKKREKAEKKQLVETPDPVMVMMAMKKIPEKDSKKPILIKLDHPIFRDEDTKICLFVKDPQRDVKDMIEKDGITGIEKVMGISKLRDRYKQYEDKRQLCNSFDLFLADDAVVPLLPRLLGKTFFQKKRQPIPVSFRSGEKLAKVLQRARDSTCFYPGWGACSAVKVGRTDFEAHEIVANVERVVSAMVENIPKKWSNVQSIHLKTHDSVALPIFNNLPNQTLRISAKPGTAKKKPAEEKPAKTVGTKRKLDDSGGTVAAKKKASKK